MKILSRIIAFLLLITITAGSLVACGGGKGNGGGNNGGNNGGNGGGELAELVDYVANVKLDRNSGRLTAEATVKTFVDGDTTHFYVDSSISETGVLKARYIAINTPESTGQIEPWGKAASNFTKEKLSAATSIILESDDGRWNLDSTGDRHLVWVWYKTAEMTDYRNLNLEIMQEGLALASSYTDYVYGDICRDIYTQAREHKLYVHDKNAKDPDFYYGSAQPITLRELKTNIEKYKGTSVSFEGVVVKNSNQTAYVEEYDEETGLYFGIQVYYGFALDSFGHEILQVGNRVLIVGSVQYYDAGGTYQISDINYHAMRPDHEENIQLISSGHNASYQQLTSNRLLDTKITLQIDGVDEDGNETVEFKDYDLGFLTMHSSASMKNLMIKSMYTTSNEDSSNKGAISITCVPVVYDEQAGGWIEYGEKEIVVRTAVLLDASGNLITESRFPVGSVIDANGIVDYYNGYQLKVFSVDDITFVYKASN